MPATITDDDRRLAEVLWDYHLLSTDGTTAQDFDFILAMGSHDERVARRAAELYNQGLSKLLVTTGGFGKVTKEIWGVPEGQRFADIAIDMGVPENSILVETRAANSGDNIAFTRELFASSSIEATTGLLVTKPYMRRRAYAAAAKQWPDISWSVESPKLSFKEYPDPEVPEERMINLMVGDLQRIKVYAEDGFQIPQSIPREVWEAYQQLRDRGFDQFVIAGR